MSDGAFGVRYTENMFNFKNFKIKQMGLYNNGKYVSSLRYKSELTKTYNKKFKNFQYQFRFGEGELYVRCLQSSHNGFEKNALYLN